MKVAIFLKMLLNAIRRILGVVGFVLCSSIPAHADNPKAFDKSDPPSKLILTLQSIACGRKGKPFDNNSVVATHNNSNEPQTPALKENQLMWTAMWMLFRTQQEMLRSVTDFLGNVTFIIIIEKLSYSLWYFWFSSGHKKAQPFSVGLWVFGGAGELNPVRKYSATSLHAYPALLI